MIFPVEKSSETKYKATIEINTLEQLLEFAKEVGEPIILFASDGVPEHATLEIYDGWRE